MTTYVTFTPLQKHVIDGKVLDDRCVAVIDSKTSAEGCKKALQYFGTYFFTASFNQPPSLSDYPRGFIKL